MWNLLLLGALQKGDPLSTIAQSMQAVRSAQVKASITTNISGHNVVTRYILSFARPDRAKLELFEPQQGAIAASDRVYALNGSHFTAYDRDANEYIVRTVQNSGNLRQRLEAMIDSQDMAVESQLDPLVLERLFAGLKDSNVFRRSTIANVITFARKTAGKGASRVVLTFDPKNYMLTNADFGSGNTHLRWTYSYGPVSDLSLSPPPTARKVQAFFQRSTPPSYANPAARSAVAASITAYKRARSLSYQLYDNGRPVQFISWSGRSFYEKEGTLEASYVGGVLTLKTAHGAYSGRCPLGDAADYMAAIGLNMEPTLRVLLSGRDPIQTLLRPNMRVRIAGQMTTEDGAITIVELQSKGLKIALSIRDSDHLLASTLTEVGPSGRVDMRTERAYHYLTANRPTISIQGSQPLSELHIQRDKPHPSEWFVSEGGGWGWEISGNLEDLPRLK